VNNPRSIRVAEQIRQELSDIVMREMKDPRVAGISFTAVKVTSDLEHAKVWFTTFNEDRAGVLKALSRAAGYLRTTLSSRMQLRSVPKLTFKYDESIEHAAHISKLIDDALSTAASPAEPVSPAAKTDNEATN
jgi:ribosome-binding factor A